MTIGRLRADSIFDWRFVSLSHNTIRGAAGGSLLNAELLVAQGMVRSRYRTWSQYALGFGLTGAEVVAPGAFSTP